ncbi:MAG: type II secretion system protein GspN [Deltaproteobacteria bacterium]|nr:type II secretion system protein GspN [Deltaproteobacteria bacterium]
MQSTVAKAIVYPVFFLLCLLFFLVRGFPVQVLTKQVTFEAERRLGLKVQFGSLETLFPNGVEAETLRLIKPAEKEGEAGFSLLVDRAQARISLLGLMFGDKDVSFETELLGGKLSGELELGKDRTRVECQLAALNVARLPIWVDLFGLPLAGKLGGDLQLDISQADYKDSKGKIALQLEQAGLGAGKIKGFQVPPISLGKPRLQLKVANGKAEIETFEVNSDDVEASLEGYFLLQKELSRMTSRCKVHFKLSDKKYEEFLAQIPPELQQFATQNVDQARDKDGAFHFSLYGPLSTMQFRPLRGGVGGKPRRPKRK